MPIRISFAFAWLLAWIGVVSAQDVQAPGQTDAAAYGPELQGYEYPFPVSTFAFTSQQQSLEMAYLDVKSDVANGQTVVLLHGKNFCAAQWAGTIRALTAHGFRVIAPDQIGFCKSSNPPAYQFTFRQLAANTRALLASLGIDRAIMIGHSTGGMLAAHYALTYPSATERLVLVDPVGLEDWSAKGVPPIGIDAWYRRELKTTAAGIRAYEQSTYYAGTWKPDYDDAVSMLAGLNAGPGKATVAWNSALIYDMIMTQPVIYQLPQLRVPTLLIVGDEDTTAIGKDFAPLAVQETLGHYPDLAKKAVAAIPGATLVEFPSLGHAPQMSDPAAFHAALLDFLKR